MNLPRILPVAVLLAALAATRLPAQYGVESNIPGAGFDPPPGQAAPATAKRPQPATATPTLHVYSRETILDVLVTDAEGHPVRGLKRADFTVSEDGKPQPIRGFSEFDRDAPPTQPAALAPNTYSNAQTIPTSGPVQIFYFDLPPEACLPGPHFEQNIAVGEIVVRAKRYIADYIRTMPAGTQVAVFSFRRDYGLRLLQGFTTDGKSAAAAIDNLAVINACPPSSFDRIAAADQIAAYAAAVHGRKNLIWIGQPLDVMRDGGLSWHPGSSPDAAFIRRSRDMYNRFTAEQIAIYPLNPAGVGGGPGFGGSLGLQTLQVEEVADGTGGAAIFNNNDFKGAIAKLVADTSHYYTLSYVPPRLAEDGRYHPIKITTDHPGLRLTYRGGFNSEQPAPPDNILKVHMSQASMGLGSLPATELLFNAKVEPAQPADPQAGQSPARKSLALAGKLPVGYDTLFTLQPDQITFTQSSDGTVYNGSVEFDLAAYDSYGKVLAVRSQTLKLPLTPAEHADFESHPFQFYLPIDLPTDTITLRLGVFDGTSNRAGTFEIPATSIKPNPTPSVAYAPTPPSKP
jgi:VWFA-related protein